VCIPKNRSLVEVMTISKYLYKQHYDNYKVRKLTLLLSLFLYYIYNYTTVTSTNIYAYIPITRNNARPLLAHLVDLGLISSVSGANRVKTYSITALGSKTVKAAFSANLNKNYIGKQYQGSCGSPATRTK